MPPIRIPRSVRLIATGMTPLNPRSTAAKVSPSNLMQQALRLALDNAGLGLRDLNGLIAVPSLADTHFMEAHYLATQVGMLPGKSKIVRTVDTGGAGPVTGLLEAKRMIMYEGADLVAVVAGDAVKNLTGEEFLKRADQTCNHPAAELPSPVIPSGYDRIAQYQMKNFGITREQLAASSALMSIMASRHPSALTRKPRTIEEILSARHVAPVTSVLECARRADGGAALLLASSNFLERKGIARDTGVVVIGGGEASGPLFPPKSIDDMNEDMFSCEEAAGVAYEEAQLGPRDIDFFGLYDCFPICLIRAVEAVGLAPKGHGGAYVEEKYHQILDGLKRDPEGFHPQDVFPVNTHGGLLAFGAPWEVPAMYNIIEAFAQLTNRAGPERQIRNARRALVYGNGGIFSASAVALLSRL
ncbi:thiolase-like protein [Fimicolochytrium jonesii]|uniref:thiolase-like protein n=1 Tax=Fimicolochytrium jonesii TaxID=1396493 RepID=UPI0022FE9D8E|nr:thiolase-like protein [Fimicolochytrium jonesii]KAI8815696.1 thiolase-like protein [Fimicolochytrium jonesii]